MQQMFGSELPNVASRHESRIQLDHRRRPELLGLIFLGYICLHVSGANFTDDRVNRTYSPTTLSRNLKTSIGRDHARGDCLRSERLPAIQELTRASR